MHCSNATSLLPVDMACVCYGVGSKTPYARKYRERHGSLPWLTFLAQKEAQSADTVPWLSLLPPEAKGSLHEWGRYLFSQTPACKRGSVSIDRYLGSVRHTSTQNAKPCAVDTLVKCCAAFAHSPLSVVIDIRAALQCISRATKQLLACSTAPVICPSMIELALSHVCAAGCGKDLSQGYTIREQYGNNIKYCSEECADTVSALHGTYVSMPAHVSHDWAARCMVWSCIPRITHWLLCVLNSCRSITTVCSCAFVTAAHRKATRGPKDLPVLAKGPVQHTLYQQAAGRWRAACYNQPFTQ